MSGLHRVLEAIQKRSDDLFAFDLDGVEVVFRLPSIHQAQQYAMLLNIAETESERYIIYDSVFRNVVQDDWMANQDPEQGAGLPETVTKLVLHLSGLDENSEQYTEQLFQLYRQQSNSVLMYMKRCICSVFPGYTFESVSQLNYQNLVNIFIQAEKELIKQGRIEVEHDFTAKAQEKQKAFAVEDLIRHDKEAYQEYTSGDQEDPRKLAFMQKLREGARKRAELEEKEYKKKLLARQRQQG